MSSVAISILLLSAVLYYSTLNRKECPLSRSITSEASVSQDVGLIFDYVTQPDLWHEWHPASLSARVSSKPLKVGDTFDEVISVRIIDAIPAP